MSTPPTGKLPDLFALVLRRRILAALLCASLCVTTASARAEPVVLRLATLLPRGSTWMQQLETFAKRVKRRTRDRVVVRSYPGAIMGDERDMLRKMRQGRLDGGALTGTGLGQIVPRLRVLEMPLLFDSIDEVEATRDALAVELIAAMRSKGFELLGWGEIGWIHYFAAGELRTPRDLRRVRFWAWADDPLARALIKQFKMTAAYLAIQDVLPALQTGLIAGVYGSPYTTLALQWHTKLRYYSRAHIAYGIGALVLTRKALSRLGLRERRVLHEEARRFSRQHIAQVRRENRAAMAQLRRSGLRPIRNDGELRRELRRLAPRVWRSLEGRLFSAALLRRVIGLRDAYRARRKLRQP